MPSVSYIFFWLLCVTAGPSLLESSFWDTPLCSGQGRGCVCCPRGTSSSLCLRILRHHASLWMLPCQLVNDLCQRTSLSLRLQVHRDLTLLAPRNCYLVHPHSIWLGAVNPLAVDWANTRAYLRQVMSWEGVLLLSILPSFFVTLPSAEAMGCIFTSWDLLAFV